MSRYARSKLLAAPLLLLASFCIATPALAATPTEAADVVAVLETKMALALFLGAIAILIAAS